MNVTLTQKQVGQRLLDLRKTKGLSQEDVARLVGISRPALTQIELGNRGVDVSELQAFAQVLEFSIDEFLSPGFGTPKTISTRTDKTSAPVTSQPASRPTLQVRISVPRLQESKFRNVLLYILERCAGKPNVGETVLYKLLYFADFNYYELFEEHLTGARYRKLPYGPVPQKLDTVIASMLEKGQLQRVKTEFHGFPQTRYLPLQKADLTTLRASEKEVIDRVIAQYSDWSAAAISAFSHKDLPWLASKDGELIDYEYAFYREPPYSARNYGPETEQP